MDVRINEVQSRVQMTDSQSFLDYTEGVISTGIRDSDMAKEMVAQTPLGRPGRPEDIAPVAVFLASERSEWITGESLGASGGQW